MAGIESQHPEYTANLPKWQRIDNVTRSEDVQQYLVTLNPNDKSSDNKLRNAQYGERAQFYAVTGQTLRGLVGSVFRKWPVLVVPAELEYLRYNADGAGVSIYQQSQNATAGTIAKGRAGLFVAFPQTDGQVSRSDILSGRIIPTIHYLNAESIINWRVIQDGARVRLSLVVFAENDEHTGSDGYSVEYVPALRELALIDGIYTERKWIKGRDGYELASESVPTDADGNVWTEIPFAFIGSENNDSSCDIAPLGPLAEINIGHYRNSADYEDSVFYSGQAQPWMVGATVDHLDAMKKAGVYIGGRMLLAVPDGGSFGFAQAGPNPLVRQAMLDKLDMMIALGARMMQAGSAVKTAAQVVSENEAQHSILSLVAGNVSDAYTQAISWCGRYIGADTTDAEYTLNTEFVALATDAQELAQIVAGFVQGAVPMGDYVGYMQRRGYFDAEKTIEQYAEELPTRTE